ncbi:MAG: thioesterase [Cycloclasticus sp. symbiont of Bathymodiolus heckerae]|nr:MAG: thioesterase [Cycloclasticus sp. symbiont of Bathymodiolus heckerae]
MTKELFTHTFSMPVRWGDADALGHINNVQFVRFLESGRVAYCERVFEAMFSPELKAGWILADMQCSYLQQVHYPAQLDVYTRVSKVGNKSITLLADIYREGEEAPVVRSQGIMVWFDYIKQQTAAIPDRVRAEIKAFEKPVDGESV